MEGEILDHYRVLSRLGGGGMGEVWLAEDTRLGRQVALKMLPADMAGDAERRARLEREARSVAALNHPNIVTLYSVEEHQGRHFITMELVRGKVLGELIPADGLPPGKVLELAVPLADALAVAHREGLTHRDLKPDNIMVTEEGRPKILDFGLAKPAAAADAGEVTHMPTASFTQEGKIVGTVAYMSPEQAQGLAVDPRSDVFSFGIVLYQMATGRRPFTGDTSVSVISSILRDTPPPLTEVRPNLPRALGRIVRRCLAKEPDRRYQSTLDLRNELEDLKGEWDSGALEAPGVAAAAYAEASAPPRTARGAWFVAAAVALAAMASLLTWLLTRGTPGGPVDAGPRLRSVTQVTFGGGGEGFPSLSPDGKLLAYAASETGGPADIHVQRVGGGRAINLTPDSPSEDTHPAFSPDGERIAFHSSRDGGGLFLMGATGESVRRLTDFGYHPAWSPDGSVVYFTTESIINPLLRVSASELWAVDAAGGAPRRLTDHDAAQPAVSPSGARIAFWAVAGGQRDIWTVAAAGGEPVRVTDDSATDWSPAWDPRGGFLLFASDRDGAMNLWRIAVDEATGQVEGESQRLTSSTATLGLPSLSRDGRRLACVALNLRTELTFEPTAADGGPGRTVLELSNRQIGFADVSPDGRSLAYSTIGGQEDLVVLPLDGGAERRLTDDVHKDRVMQWSPDGRRIAFMTDRDGHYAIYAINVDGSGLEPLAAVAGRNLGIPVWSPDGTQLAAYTPMDHLEAYIFDVSGQQPVQQLPPWEETGVTFAPSAWSPDGRRLAGLLLSPDGRATAVATYDLQERRYTKHLQVEIPFIVLLQWLGDSRRLVYQPTGRGVYILDTASGEQQAIETVRLGPFDSLQWISPDATSVLVSHSHLESDVWLLELD